MHAHVFKKKIMFTQTTNMWPLLLTTTGCDE